MSYQLIVTPKPNYLHGVMTGANTMENVIGYLEELQQECAARNCFNVLIEERLVGRRLETWDVYQIAAQGSNRALGKFRAIAFVDVNAQGDLMKFAETVANNRGVPLNVFSSVADAEKWLAGKAG
jgi:hypothetical protein